MNLAIYPILLPLLTAIMAMFWGRPSPSRRWFFALSGVAQLVVALVILRHNWEGQALVLGVGYWTYRVGIMLVIDLLAALMVCLSTLVTLAAMVYTFVECRPRIEHPLRLPLMQFLLVGINLSFCTGDLFNLFVAFEVMLISSYALLTLEADNWGVKQAYPYLAINLVGGTLFLCAAGLAYGLFGTLNLADIGARVELMSGDARVLALVLLLLVVFCTKAGLFPLFYWLPNSYPSLPIPLAAIFAAMLTKVGVYVLIRLMASVFPHDLTQAHFWLMILAGWTMVLAILGAVARNFIRGILAFNLLSHIGFMVLAIGFFTERSVAAAIYYMMHHIVVMASLFLLTGALILLNRTDHLRDMGNLWKQTPWVGVVFLVQALSLSGLPPLSGFWGKYLIIEAGLQRHAYILVAAVILASILTLLSVLKIWNRAFCRVASEVTVHRGGARWSRFSWIAAGLMLVSLAMGFGAESFMRFALEASHRVMDKAAYTEQVFRVLGKGGN